MLGSGGRLRTVDALRALAFLMVLWQHALLRFYFNAWTRQPRLVFFLESPIFQCWSGVALFMVISGFCIHARVAAQPSQELPNFLVFWTRRLRRLYPPYLSAIVFAAGMLWLRSWINGDVPKVSAHEYGLALLAHVTLMFPLWGRSLVLLGNPAFWTLALEEQLYLMYFILLRLRHRLGMAKAFGCVVFVTLATRSAAVYLTWAHPNLAHPPLVYVHPWDCPLSILWLLLGPSRWSEWALGFVAVEAALGRVFLPWWCSHPLTGLLSAGAAIVCQCSVFGLVFEDPLWGLTYFVLLNWMLKMEGLGWMRPRFWGWAAALGTATYSLYLVHLPILLLSLPLLNKVLPKVAARLASMLFVFPVAHIWFKQIEEPSIRWSQQTRKRIAK